MGSPADRSLSLLFVSGVSDGGAPRSTIDLARALAALGHQSHVLLGGPGRSRAIDLGVRLAVKAGRTSPAARAIERPLRRLGCRRTIDDRSTGDVSVEITVAPENAARQWVAQHDVDAVVVNSVNRAQYRWIHGDLARRGIPLVLYLREERAVGHITESRLVPDLAVANAVEYIAPLQEHGVACSYVPSVVDLSKASVETSRRTALMVNPVAMNRPGIAIALAERRPDVPVVLQVSWELDASDRAALIAAADRFPNLQLREPVPSPSHVYADAKLLLVPYMTRRPRVIAEAQWNGIPVLATDQPSLADAVGGGGVLVQPDADHETWATEFGRIWDDDTAYDELRHAAAAHARRSEADPVVIAQRFVTEVRSVVAS